MNTENIAAPVIISKTLSCYKSVKWVCKALSKDPTREALNYLYCDERDRGIHLVAVDGTRLHVFYSEDFECMGLKSGQLYSAKISASEIVLLPSDCRLNFPHWKQVVPEYGDSTPSCVLFTEPTKLLASHATTSIAEAILEKKLSKGNISEPFDFPRFDDSKMQDALGLGTLFTKTKGSMNWELSCEDCRSPLLFKSAEKDCEKIAVLMPVKKN